MYNHWATIDNQNYIFRQREVEILELPPGIYTIKATPKGIFFVKRMPQNLSELVKFQNTDSDTIVNEIRSFWTKKELFKRHNFPFRRGILLYGPPGTGKSCSVKLIMEDVVKMGGLAIMFTAPDVFRKAFEGLREIQPNTPVVTIIEDIDIWVDYESELTNLLDGHGAFENVVVLATTNYLKDLPDTIKNRPSRFDKRIYIGTPNEKIRADYIKHLLINSDFENKIDYSTWAAQTEGLTFAHIKELYLSVCFFDNKFDEALLRLREMLSPVEDSPVEDPFVEFFVSNDS